jgi:hypothetical protein
VTTSFVRYNQAPRHLIPFAQVQGGSHVVREEHSSCEQGFCKNFQIVLLAYTLLTGAAVQACCLGWTMEQSALLRIQLL